MAKRARTVSLFDLLAGETKFTSPMLVPIVDLYAGAGGFSCGATLAGHTIKIAVDCNDIASEWHEKNHPNTDHYRLWLPHDRLLAQLPPPNTLWHLHGSPPCQLLSQAAGGGQRKERWDEGLENVRFYIELALERKPASWTMEQVPNTVVLQLLDEYKAKHPTVVDYTVVNMQEYGIPQSRKRVIAGSPWMIKRLIDLRNPMGAPRVIDFCPSRPEEAIGLKGTVGSQGTKKNPGNNKAFQKATSVMDWDRRAKKGGLHAPAPTVTALSTLRWVAEGGKTIRMATVREEAQLQTFPDSYQFPDRGKEAHRMVGNSVPPLFAKLLMSDYRLPFAHVQHTLLDHASFAPIAHNHVSSAVFPARVPTPPNADGSSSSAAPAPAQPPSPSLAL